MEKFLNKVLQGDCLELLPQIPDRSIPLVLCDLPYGTTVIPWDEVIDMERLWGQYERVMTPNGVVLLTSQGLFTGKLIMSNPKLFKYKVVWVKSAATNFLNGKIQPRRRHEDICVFYTGKPAYHPQMRRGKVIVSKPKARMSDSQGTIKALGHTTRSRDRYPDDVVFCEVEVEDDGPITDSLYFKNAVMENGFAYHPTQKPVDLGRYLIRTYSNPGDIVLDNACGSGSFLVAAVMEQRQFIGMEKNEKAVHKGLPVDYVDISRRRIAEAVRWRREEDQRLKLF